MTNKTLYKTFALSLFLHTSAVLALGLWICPWLEKITLESREKMGVSVVRGRIDFVLVDEQTEAPRVAAKSVAVVKAAELRTVRRPTPEAVSAIQKTGDLVDGVEVEREGTRVTLTIADYKNWVVQNNTPPLYPRLARLRGEKGRVLLRVVVAPLGTPVESVTLEQSSGSELLDRLSLEAVRGWKFPAFTAKSAAHAQISFPISFAFALD